MKTYLVGGAVRDKLLGLPVKDRDWIVVGSTPEQMLAQGFKAVGKGFPVFLHPSTKEEYALARTERKCGKGYKGFEFYTSEEVTLEEDLKRRDLTINAMAESESGELIDPFNGKADIEQGMLRHVSNAFVEDPLRLLRVARFAATFGFRVAPETNRLLKQISVSDELETLVPQRVWKELEKALIAKHPTRFILVLHSCNALSKLFPEIDALFGTPQPKQHHPEIDSGLHTIMSLNQAARLSKDPVVRFATLVHDLGKITTPKAALPSHIGHDVRGVKVIEKLCQRYCVPIKYQKLATCVSKFHIDCHRIQEMKPATVARKLKQLDAFRQPDRFKQFLLACTADARGRAGAENSDYPQAEYFMKAFEIANGVNARSFKASGLKGKALGEAIQQKRAEKIRALFNSVT